MSLGAVLGVFLSEVKKACITLGLLDANGDPVSGGGSSVEDWDAEVTTLAALNSAIADGARVLITSDITVSSTNQINLFSGRCTIGRKPECQIIQTGSAALFQLGSATTCDVTLVTVGEDSEKLPFIDTSGSTATYLASGDSGALVRLKGDVSLKTNSGLTLRGVCALDLDGPTITLVLPDGALNTGTTSIRCGVLNAVGGGSSSYLAAALSSTASSSIKSTRVTGSWRQVSSSPITEYALGFSGAVELGPVTGSLGALGYLFIDEGVVLRKPHIAQGGISARDAHIFGGYTPSLQAATASSSTRSKSLFSGLVFDAWAYTSSKATYKNCRLPTSSPQTLGSGSNSDFEACIIPSTLTLNNSSGSACRFRDCELDGTLVLNSGAAARVTGLRGSGTFTNNDPLSIVTGSQSAANDSTPATRRYGDATLDALLDNHVAYWSGKTSPCPNKAPIAACNAGGAMRSITGAVASTGTAFDLVDATDKMVAPMNSWTPSQGDFTVSFYIDLDVAISGEENIFDMNGGGNLAVNALAGGALRIYLGGVNVLDTSASSISTSGGNQRVTMDRTNGTLTVRVNGVSRGSTANSTAIGVVDQCILGENGSNAVDGKISRITILDMGIPDATEQLWDTYSLAGAGA